MELAAGGSGQLRDFALSFPTRIARPSALLLSCGRPAAWSRRSRRRFVRPV